MKTIIHKLLKILKEIGAFVVEFCKEEYQGIFLLFLLAIAFWLPKNIKPVSEQLQKIFRIIHMNIEWLLIGVGAVFSIFTILICIWYGYKKLYYWCKERRKRRKANCETGKSEV